MCRALLVIFHSGIQGLGVDNALFVGIFYDKSGGVEVQLSVSLV